MNAEQLLWRDIWNISGNYFSGIKEKDSKWYQSFSQLPLELVCYDCRRSK